MLIKGDPVIKKLIFSELSGFLLCSLSLNVSDFVLFQTALFNDLWRYVCKAFPSSLCIGKDASYVEL